MWEGKVGNMYLRQWQQEDSKANVVIIHGLGEHSGRYVETAEKLFAQGFSVYTGDLTGHGLSEGERIYIDSIEDYMDNVDFLLSRAEAGKPTFLLGHSMGGLIVLYYMLMKRNTLVTGVIASSPYIRDKMKVSALKYYIGKAAAMFLPKLRIETGLQGSLVCRDPEIVRSYDQDKLNCSQITGRWFLEVEKARRILQAKAGEFAAPILVLQAGADIVVDPEGTRAFYEAISSKDKEFVLYEGFYHEILNDPEREQVITKMIEWMEKEV